MGRENETEDLVRGLKYRTRPEYREALRAMMLAEIGDVATTEHQPMWRALMKSRPFRYATVSSVLAATLALILLFCGPTGGNHEVVLAEVLAKTRAMSTLVLQEERVFFLKGTQEPFLKGHAVKYISSDRGQVEICSHSSGSPIYTAYFLKKENRLLVLFHDAKGYLDLPLRGRLASLSDDVTPQGLVRLLTRHGYTVLSRTERDGRQVEGFEAKPESIQDVLDAFREYQEVAFLFPVKAASARVWVDIETSLPFRIEAELEAGPGLLTGFQQGVAHFIGYDFQWNADIAPGMFVPEIPADYRCLDLHAQGK